jgi:hypothetical protein
MSKKPISRPRQSYETIPLTGRLIFTSTEKNAFTSTVFSDGLHGLTDILALSGTYLEKSHPVLRIRDPVLFYPPDPG